MVDRHQALSREEIIELLSVWRGITTADGATPGNNTLIDSALIGKNDFITGKAILIGPGAAASSEDKSASAFDPLTGQITVEAGFSHQIKAGTTFWVLNISSSSSVSTVLDTITTKTNNLPASPADQVTSLAIQTALGRKFSFVDFWSAPTDKVTVVNAPVVDIPFPDIVVVGLPAGLTVKRVVLIMSSRALNNTSGAANFINAAGKTLRIKTAAGAWGTNDIVAITFANNSLYVKASAKEPGPVIIGAADLSALVTGNATYNVRSDQTTRGDALVAQANSLELYDIQVGLRVFYS
jgi:hypothetical protein